LFVDLSVHLPNIICLLTFAAADPNGFQTIFCKKVTTVARMKHRFFSLFI